MPSIGIISQTMPVAVMRQVILHIIMGIGIMPPIIDMPFIGMPCGIIMPWGIMPIIIWGIMPPIGMFIIGICIWGFIGIKLRLAIGYGA
jgi:hypothetical protein